MRQVFVDEAWPCRNHHRRSAGCREALGYAVGHGPDIAPGEPAAERASFGAVVLVGRLREAIRRLNPAIPEDAQEEAVKTVLAQAELLSAG